MTCHINNLSQNKHVTTRGFNLKYFGFKIMGKIQIAMIWCKTYGGFGPCRLDVEFKVTRVPVGKGAVWTRVDYCKIKRSILATYSRDINVFSILSYRKFCIYNHQVNSKIYNMTIHYPKGFKCVQHTVEIWMCSAYSRDINVFSIQ